MFLDTLNVPSELHRNLCAPVRAAVRHRSVGSKTAQAVRWLWWRCMASGGLSAGAIFKISWAGLISFVQ